MKLNSKTFHIDLSIHSRRNFRGYFERSPLELERAIQKRKKKKKKKKLSAFLNCGSLGNKICGQSQIPEQLPCDFNRILKFQTEGSPKHIG
jgi:hypothetical protein